jgi:oligopeptide transport system substrate-binding protein
MRNAECGVRNVRKSVLSPFLISPFALVILCLSGCHKTTPVELGNRNQVLYFGNLSEPTDLDPHLISSQQDHQIVLNLFEGLTSYDPKTANPVPGVAEGWDLSPDGRIYTFHLRENAKWSNGDPVTAADFLYSFQRILSPGLASEYAYMLFVVQNAKAFNEGKLTDFSQVGFSAPNPHTLVVSLVSPTPYLPALCCHSSWYPVHRGTIEKFGKIDTRFTPWTRPGNLVGNGAFQLKRWRVNTDIVIEPNPQYWNAAQVKLREAHFLPVESADVEERQFRSGMMHVTATIPTLKIAVYRKNRPDVLHTDPMLATYFYKFNVTRPPFNDVRVRRALTLCVNREQLIESVTRGGQRPAYNLTPPNTGGFTVEPRLKRDPEEARRLLAAAGYPGGKGFPKVELLYNTSEGHKQIAEAIQQMWRAELGIQIQLTNQEAKVWNTTMQRMDYQIARYAWVGDYNDPSTFLELMTSASGNNQTGWNNPAFDHLVDEATRAKSQADRFALFQQAEDLLASDCPILPIYFYTRCNLVLPNVKGFYSNILDLHPLQYVHLE